MYIKNKDKYMHFGVGAVIGFAGSLVHPFVGVVLTIVIAYYKEYLDKKNPDKHTYDGWDAYSTVAGLVPGQLLVYIAQYNKYWAFLL